MVAHSGLFVAPASGVGTSPVDGRLALAGIIGAVPQVVQGGTVSQSSSSMQFTVGQSVLELPDPTNAAAAFVSAIDQTILTPAVGPSTGSRVDLIVAKQNNPQNGDADASANFSLIPGAAGAPGVAPAVPAGYFRFADIGVPTNASNAAACTVTLRSPTTFAPVDLLAPTLALLNTVTGSNGQHATVWNDTATNNGDYLWNGTQWVQLPRTGLIPIVPTSVAGTGVTVGANGAVAFTAATAVSLNGIFTTRFDNYRIVVDIPSSSAVAGGQIHLRSGGTDDAGANYSYQQSWAAAAAVTANNAGGVGQWGAFPVAGVEASAVWDLFDPALTKPTRIQVRASMWSNTTTGVDSTMSGRHNPSAAYDGLTYTPSAGAVTGTIRVYGYNNN